MSDYQQFLASKHTAVRPVGVDVDAAAVHPALFPFQRDIVCWAVRLGRKFIGIELKRSYFDLAIRHLKDVERSKTQIDMFALLPESISEAA